MKYSLFFWLAIVLSSGCGAFGAKHPIFGKWQSRNQVPGAFITFRSDRSMSVTTFDASGEVLDRESHKFRIVDEHTILFTDAALTDGGIEVTAKLLKNGRVSIECRGSTRPVLCDFKMLEKQKE